MTLEHTGDISSLVFLFDGQLASGNSDGEISMWDTVTGTCVRTVNAHSDLIKSLSVSHTKLASGSYDGTVRVWDMVTWECMHTFECSDKVYSVALYPNGDRVAVCGLKMLYVWDTATPRLIVSKNLSECNGVAVSSDGKWLAVASDEATSLYDASTVDRIWSHDRSSKFLSFSPDSCQLVSANSSDHKVELFDVQTGNHYESFDHNGVSKAIFSYDGTRLLSGESYSVSLGIVLISSIYQLPMVALVDSGISTCQGRSNEKMVMFGE